MGPTNKNVELGGRGGFKKIHHGVTNWICKVRRINRGWHISIARQLHVFFSTTPLLTPALRLQISETYCLLFRTHSFLRNPLKKDDLRVYQGTINNLLDRMVIPLTPSRCATASNTTGPDTGVTPASSLGVLPQKSR
jgi:hypothetical protein